MIDGRGLYMVKLKLKTREKVRKFIAENPDMTKKDTAKALNISPLTLTRHLNALRDE